jgi:endonuclease/exonuclease/phosphatase (EEP) superfamily protein YafD
MQASSSEYYAAVSGYIDAWSAAKSLGTAINYYGNCDGCTRNSRIDYIFSSGGAWFLSVKSAQMYDTRDSYGYMPSDHKPLVVTYSIR